MSVGIRTRIVVLFLAIGFLIDFTDIPEQLWLRVFPIKQITIATLIIKSPWLVFNVFFAYLSEVPFAKVHKLAQIIILCGFGQVFSFFIKDEFANEENKWTVLGFLTILECVPAFIYTILSGYLAANSSGENSGQLSRDAMRSGMIGQFIGRCVSGFVYGESDIKAVFLVNSLVFIVFSGLCGSIFCMCEERVPYEPVVMLANDEDESFETKKPKEEVVKEGDNQNDKSHTAVLLLFSLQPSVATAVFYLMTGPLHVLPSVMTEMKTGLSLVRVVFSFCLVENGDISGFRLSYFLHMPLVVAHIGYIIFASQTYTQSIDDSSLYFLIGCVTTMANTYFAMFFNEYIARIANKSNGRETITMAKWTSLFIIVSLCPTLFEYTSIAVMGIDHGNFNYLPVFAVGCLSFTFVSCFLHLCLRSCGIIL
jgi:hypothetical protein